MDHIYEIEHTTKQIHFIRLYEKVEDEHVKASYVHNFLSEHREFFTIKEIAEILKVTRMSIERAIWGTKNAPQEKDKHRLDTYTLAFWRVPRECPNPANKKFWEVEEEGSNFERLVHRDQFREYLHKIITKSYNRELGGYSILIEQEKEVVDRIETELGIELRLVEQQIASLKDDLSRRLSKQLTKRNFYVIIQHLLRGEDYREMIEAILERRAKLHTARTLADETEYGEASLRMYIKTSNALYMSLSEQGKEVSRALFLDGESVYSTVKGKLKLLFNNKIKILDVECPPIITTLFKKSNEFIEPLDYYSCYIFGCRKPPGGWYRLPDGTEILALEGAEEGKIGLPLKDLQGKSGRKASREEESSTV